MLFFIVIDIWGLLFYVLSFLFFVGILVVLYTGLLGCSGYDDDYLALGLVECKVLCEAYECATLRIGMEFRYLATYGCLSLGSHYLGQLGEGLDQTEGRLVDNHGALLCGKYFKTAISPLLLREEAFETELLVGQSRHDECGHKGCGSGKALHLYSGTATGTHKEKSGVRYGRCAGIGDEGNGLAGYDACHDRVGRVVLVELVVRLQSRLYVVVLEQHATGAGVLGEDTIDLAQDAQGTQGDVFEITHGCGY